MQEIGKMLREAREEKGLSLGEVSKQTKIQEKYLQSLEEGDFSPFAGKVYAKGALKNYAEAIGLDARDLAGRFDQAVQQANAAADPKADKIPQEEGKPLFTSREKKPFPVVAVSWLLILALIALGSLWYLYRQGAEPDSAISYNDEFIVDANEEFPPALEDEENYNLLLPDNQEREEPPEFLPEKELRLVSRDSREHLYSLLHVEEKEITITFTARCWVQVIQDGQRVEEKNFDPGETLQLNDAARTQVRLGYPAGARIIVNGLVVESTRNVGSPLDVIIEKE